MAHDRSSSGIESWGHKSRVRVSKDCRSDLDPLSRITTYCCRCSVVYLRVAQYREPHRKQLDTSRRRLGHGLVGPNKNHALDGGPNPPWEGDFFRRGIYWDMPWNARGLYSQWYSQCSMWRCGLSLPLVCQLVHCWMLDLLPMRQFSQESALPLRAELPEASEKKHISSNHLCGILYVGLCYYAVPGPTHRSH